MVALLFGVMLASASDDGIANIPRNLLEMVTTPVQKGMAWVSQSAGGFFDQLTNFQQNAAQNEQLKNEVALLRRQLADYEALKDENDQLKEISGVKQVHADFEMTPAFVISRDPADSYGSFLIDKGTLHGVALNDPVMTESGLVGIVTRTAPTSARVTTLLSPQIDVGTFENVSKELGTIRGDVKLAEQGLTKLSILAGDSRLKPGDMIMTAGVSGLYPKGVPVGRVEEVRTESHGVTRYATIRPFEDVTRSDSVIIVTAFLGQGDVPLDFSGQ